MVRSSCCTVAAAFNDFLLGVAEIKFTNEWLEWVQRVACVMELAILEY